MKAVATFISSLFHPLFVPIYGLLFLMYVPSAPKSFLVADSLYYSSESVKYVILFLFGIFGVLAPGVSLLLFKYNQTITSLQLEIQEERRMPIFMMSVYMAILFFFLAFQVPKTAIPQIIPGIALGASCGIFITGLVNQYAKISLHMLGMGMLTGAVYGYFKEQLIFSNWVLPVIFIVSGFVATSRLILDAHSFSQLIAGYALGFISLLISISLFLH